MRHCGGWSRCRCWRRRMSRFAAIRTRRRCWTSAFALLPPARKHDSRNDEDQQQEEQQNNYYDPNDDPHRKVGSFLSFRLQLLAALNQSIDFRVLREESLYFFKLRNRGGVILVPVIIQALTIEVVSRTQIVRSAGALHILHHRVRRHNEREP